MNSEKKSEAILENPKVNVRIILAASWTSHFLLWTFGDMVSLLQETTEPVSDELLAFVAAPLAVIQALMIIFTLLGEAKTMRWINIGISPVFLIFNLGYLGEAIAAWQYVLGIAYLLINILIIWIAWNWPKQGDNPRTENK